MIVFALFSPSFPLSCSEPFHGGVVQHLGSLLRAIEQQSQFIEAIAPPAP